MPGSPPFEKVWTAAGGSSADGTRLQIWTCTGGANQNWTL
nr:RICIN domain-containing protein [Lentzea sp. NBRC 102530]